MRFRRARTGAHLIAVMPPGLIGVAGVLLVAVGVVVLVRIVALVRDPEGVTRRRRDVAHFPRWTPQARVSYVRGQRNRALGCLLVGAVLLAVAIGRSRSL
jgi:hypothetical protein